MRLSKTPNPSYPGSCISAGNISSSPLECITKTDIATCSNVSYASLPLFIPTIIAEMGTFSDIKSNGLSAPPYVACFFWILAVCWLSDRFKVRGPFCALGGLTAGIGFIINATTTTTGPRYFSLFLSVQIFSSVPILLAWVANIHATESKRAGGYTILATMGQCGPLLGE